MSVLVSIDMSFGLFSLFIRFGGLGSCMDGFCATTLLLNASFISFSSLLAEIAITSKSLQLSSWKGLVSIYGVRLSNFLIHFIDMNCNNKPCKKCTSYYKFLPNMFMMYSVADSIFDTYSSSVDCNTGISCKPSLTSSVFISLRSFIFTSWREQLAPCLPESSFSV